MKREKGAAQDLRAIAANTARDLALGLRLASLRMDNYEPGQGKEAARELAEQLSASARRAVELYYLESLTQAVTITEGPVRLRRTAEVPFLSKAESLEIENLKTEVAGCYNKLGFALLLEAELERARRRKSPLSVALLKLEKPNEREVQEVARQARDCCRLLDVLGMFGDRGVGILLPDTSLEGGRVASQRVLTSYESARELVGGNGGVNLAVGLASHPEDGGESKELLLRADERAGGGSLLEPVAVG
jgi:GGDEF domain-containing protein